MKRKMLSWLRIEDRTLRNLTEPAFFPDIPPQKKPQSGKSQEARIGLCRLRYVSSLTRIFSTDEEYVRYSDRIGHKSLMNAIFGFPQQGHSESEP